MKKDNDSLAHTSWNCKYHIVFAPKYRRQIIYGKYKATIGRIIRELCERKGVIIHEALQRPQSYVGQYLTQIKCFKLYGVSERKRQSDDIWSIRQFKVSLWEPQVLVSKLFRGYSRPKQGEDRRIHSESSTGGPGSRTTEFVRSDRSFHGRKASEKVSEALWELARESGAGGKPIQ